MVHGLNKLRDQEHLSEVSDETAFLDMTSSSLSSGAAVSANEADIMCTAAGLLDADGQVRWVMLSASKQSLPSLSSSHHCLKLSVPWCRSCSLAGRFLTLVAFSADC